MCNGSAIARRDSLYRRLALQKGRGAVSETSALGLAATSHYHLQTGASGRRDQHGCFEEDRRDDAAQEKLNVVIACHTAPQVRFRSIQGSPLLLGRTKSAMLSFRESS